MEYKNEVTSTHEYLVGLVNYQTDQIFDEGCNKKNYFSLKKQLYILFA